MVNCTICNRMFLLTKKRTPIYLTEEPINPIAKALTKPDVYQTVDCPHCGGQLRLSRYYERVNNSGTMVKVDEVKEDNEVFEELEVKEGTEWEEF